MANKSDTAAPRPDTVYPTTVSPVKDRRDTAPLEEQRQQSGGLDDDPTKSGSAVYNRKSFKNLKGGR